MRSSLNPFNYEFNLRGGAEHLQALFHPAFWGAIASESAQRISAFTVTMFTHCKKEAARMAPKSSTGKAITALALASQVTGVTADPRACSLTVNVGFTNARAELFSLQFVYSTLCELITELKAIDYTNKLITRSNLFPSPLALQNVTRQIKDTCGDIVFSDINNPYYQNNWTDAGLLDLVNNILQIEECDIPLYSNRWIIVLYVIAAMILAAGTYRAYTRCKEHRAAAAEMAHLEPAAIKSDSAEAIAIAPEEQKSADPYAVSATRAAL